MTESARRYPSTIGGAVYLVILLVTLGGVGYAVLGSWRVGVGWISASLFAAAVARLVFTDVDAGMLKVRHKYVDAALLAGAAALLAFLAATIPNQPG
ncbi:DUF3017 domain-containing protein [Nocardioides limicola]|uniref:DUF3017 domain-containing protein n=1 Tax=Nocardioides limicola TaxID=2803368 RepID=UPI00193B5940|nr:DUF3017 domain-containing protein [Nocardioides sp. DJM-14]